MFRTRREASQGDFSSVLLPDGTQSTLFLSLGHLHWESFQIVVEIELLSWQQNVSVSRRLENAVATVSVANSLVWAYSYFWKSDVEKEWSSV